MANENYKLVIDVDNRDEILGELDEAIDRALEAVGMAASDYAAAKCPVDTGLLIMRRRNALLIQAC